MYHYSKTSKDTLSTVNQDLQILFNEIIKYVDCTIVSGLRTAEDQFELFKKGRAYKRGRWVVVDVDKIVTYKDGYYNKSYHQSGNAIDVVPYPYMYNEKDMMIRFGGFVLGIATKLKEEGKIKNEIEWGFDLWGWDEAHFQIKS